METFDKISLQNKVLHPNTGEMNLAYIVTQNVSHILSQFEEPQSATRSLKTVPSFCFNFQSICPHQIFLLVLDTILTHRNL